MNVESMLREGLADQAASVEVPEDPWTGFERRETRHRRTRRVRLGVASGALASVLGLQSGVIPMPGWAPSIAVASTNDALVSSPTRGSLAGDRAWLERMRREIHDLGHSDELWRVTDRSKIKFLYAADVGHLRLMLAYVPVRFGFLTDPQLVWYEGPAGATPEQMMEAGSVDGDEQAVTRVLTSSDGPGVAVAVGPQGSTAAISDGFEFTAEGTVRFNPPVSGPAGSGIAQTALPASPGQPGVKITLTRNGRTEDIGWAGGWDGSLPEDAEFDAVISKALGDRTFDLPTLRAWLKAALQQGRMALGGTQLTVRWTGEVGGTPAALFTVQKPGQGVLAFAFHGTAESYRDGLRLLLPASGADERPIAWRTYASGGEAVKTDQVMVVGPVTAATVKLTATGGAPVTVKLDKFGMGTAVLAPDTAATVTAYAADGSTIASTPVPPFDDGTGVIGTTLATRVVR